MPHVKKDQQTLVIEKVSTTQGEITVNLNLNIQVEGGNIQVSANSLPEEKKDILKQEAKPEFIPEEEFDLEIPVISGFGKQV